ncbi:MAG: response regulator [Acidimicrobiales bacterium]
MEKSRVVIAEDEALIRLDLKESLIEEGYDVVGEAADGEQALRLVAELNPDVAILDIKMPGTDGLVAAKEIISKRQCAVVILTAFSQRDLIEQARDAGALAYVVKPFHRNELVPAIELAVARFRELTALASQAEALTDQLETRKLVDRAKGRLMDQHAMSEHESFRFVQQGAMSSRMSMREVAERILSGELTPSVGSLTRVGCNANSHAH